MDRSSVRRYANLFVSFSRFEMRLSPAHSLCLFNSGPIGKMHVIPAVLKKILSLSAAGLLIISPWGCNGGDEISAQIKAPLQAARQVNVSTVTALPPRGKVEYVGALAAFLKANVSSETGGTIERLLFEKGMKVKKGRLLAEISTKSIRIDVQQATATLKVAESKLEKTQKGSRPEEILIARSALQAAEAERVEAEKHFKRIKNLYRFESVSDSLFDSARRGAQMARAREESAKQRLSLVNQGPRREDRQAAQAAVEQAQAVLALAKDRLRKSKLLAPFDGVIAFRDVEPGEVIPPGTTITRVVNLDRMKIKLSINEKDILILTKHKQFNFTVDAIYEKTFLCQLFFLAPTAMSATRAFPTEMIVVDPDPRMADGMTARVQLPLVNARHTIKIPSAWLTEENGKIGLYVVKDGNAHFKTVTLGAYYDQRVEILSGLTANEQVITNPAGIKTGDPVTYSSE